MWVERTRYVCSTSDAKGSATSSQAADRFHSMWNVVKNIFGWNVHNSVIHQPPVDAKISRVIKVAKSSQRFCNFGNLVKAYTTLIPKENNVAKPIQSSAVKNQYWFNSTLLKILWISKKSLVKRNNERFFWGYTNLSKHWPEKSFIINKIITQCLPVRAPRLSHVSFKILISILDLF